MTTLCVPLPFLLGFNTDVTQRIGDYLPRTLERMTIRNDLCPDDRSELCDYEWFAVLQNWMENIRSSTPRVHRVIIFVPRKCNLHNLATAEFQQQWKEVSVDYEVFRTGRIKRRTFSRRRRDSNPRSITGLKLLLHMLNLQIWACTIL